MAMPRLASRFIRGPFTIADYYRMAETGLLDSEARVELLDGLIVAKSVIGPRHAGIVLRLTRLFSAALGGRAAVNVQNPAVLDEYSEPEPDVTVLKPRDDDYTTSKPRPSDVLLLIEVADTSLDKDREIKLPLYARSRIAEVWIVDLQSDVIEVYREPGEGGYAQMRRSGAGDSLTPHLLATVTLSVAEILR